MTRRPLAIALLAALPILLAEAPRAQDRPAGSDDPAGSQDPVGADEPVRSGKSGLIPSNKEEAESGVIAPRPERTQEPPAPEAAPTAQEPELAPAEAPAATQEEEPASDAEATEEAEPAIDRSGWPAIEGIHLDTAAMRRAHEVAAHQPLADETISAAEMRRTLVYLVGSRELRSFKLDLEIEAEMERQIANGRPEADFTIDEAEIQAGIDQLVESIKEQYPTLDHDAVLRLNNIQPDNLLRLQRQSRLFTKVFMPENPDNWPDITVESIKGTGQAAMFEAMRTSFARFEEAVAAGEMTPEQIEQAKQGQGTMRQLMAQSVMKALNDSSTVETAVDGLPADVAMRVNGQDISTDQVFAVLAPRLSPSDIDLARRWILKCRLLERTLAARGYLLTPAEASAAYDEAMAPMAESMFPLEFFVVNVKGFPSLHLYEQLHRYIASYERMIADEMTDDVLQAHFEQRGNDLLNVARVGTEVILLSAYDFKSGTWKENGWEEAEQRAYEVGRKLAEAGGSNWAELQDEYSDFWDPPAPTTPMEGQQMPRRKNKGRFAPMSRNELIKELHENEFTIFVDGSSITDEIFFHLSEGAIGGPWKGRFGYYIARITARTAPRQSRTLEDPVMLDMLEEDYATTRFNAFAQELYDAALEE